MADQLTYDRFLGMLSETFDLALNTYNYKGGAFKGKVDHKTHPVTVLNLLVASELVTEDEKISWFVPLLFILEGLRKEDFEGKNFVEIRGMTQPAWTLHEVFEKDMRNRGEYIPPWLVQEVDGNNNIARTFEITDSGVRTFEGGELGVPPSAPEAWEQGKTHSGAGRAGQSPDSTRTTTRQERREAAKSARKLAKKAAKATGSYGTSMEGEENATKSKIGDELSKDKSGGNELPDERPDEVEDAVVQKGKPKEDTAANEIEQENDDFGAAFEHNIRRRGFF